MANEVYHDGHSHLFVAPETDIEVLHTFAANIGLKRSWCHLGYGKTVPHYNLTTKRKQKQAEFMGAVNIDRDEAVAIWKQWSKQEE